MDRIIPVAIAVVEDRGRFLVGKRLGTGPLHGLWEFPGGKVHPGELAEDAAIRECLEETGVVVSVRELLVRHTQRYSHGTIDLHFFRCSLASHPAPPFDPFQWTERSALARMEFPDGNRPLLKLLSLEV